MLLHLGKKTTIYLKDIIAIIDADTANKSEYTKTFLKLADENISNKSDNIKSYVITEGKEKKIKIYTSNISTLTLQKRAGFMEDIK